MTSSSAPPSDSLADTNDPDVSLLNPLPRPIGNRLFVLLAGNLIVLIAIFALLKAGGSLSELLKASSPNVAPVILAGLGLTGIIYTGAIDLSIASVLVMAGTVFGVCVNRGIDPVGCYLACVATAFGLSAANGYLIRFLRVPAIVLTLGGLAFYRGLALILADTAIPGFGGFISIQAEAYHVPGKQMAGPILLGVLVVALFWEAFAKTPRRWLALGNSDEACRLLGLNPDRVLQSAFVVSGLFLGLASLLYVTRIQVVEPSRMALGFELQVIGAVVLGGTNIFGGEGSFLGTVFGAYFLYFTAQLLIYAGVSPYFQDAITGALILVVIGLDCALHRKRKLLEELS